MLTLDEISAALADRRVSVVAEATGLHRNTIMDIRDGRNTNPTYAKVKALSDYLAPEHPKASGSASDVS